jgi:hypothetical protein
MSNWKHAYGWVGHIISPESEVPSDPNDNVVAVPDAVFHKIMADMNSCKLDARIMANALGNESDADDALLATGVFFSVGFEHFGTVFSAAYFSGISEQSYNEILHYKQAMKDIYGIELPPARHMVGCSSEH